MSLYQHEPGLAPFIPGALEKERAHQHLAACGAGGPLALEQRGQILLN
jgi:hypothetical protein